jgi:hypothetical protein
MPGVGIGKNPSILRISTHAEGREPMSERSVKLTRPDMPLPGRSGSAPDTGKPASGTGNWHRYHYPIGAFAAVYGVTVLLTSLFAWGTRREELAEYVGSGPATPALVLVLVLVKIVELLLVLLTVAGLVRRRDVWLLPALAGWVAGFALFALLDVFTGRWGGLLEHVIYLAVFVFLLFGSYALSVKARVETKVPAQSGEASQPSGLTRTQELALEALNRWRQRLR